MSASEPAAAPRVLAIRPLDRRARRVRLVLGDPDRDRDADADLAADPAADPTGDGIEIALEVLQREGVGIDDPVDAALRARLLDADLRWRVREAALVYLAHRPRSRGETRRRLRERGFAPELIEPCLDRLAGEGLLDDDAFADLFVRDRLRLRPRGPARLRDELRGRGVAPDAAERAVDRGLRAEGVTDASLAVDAALAWLRGKERERTALASARFGPERDGALRRLVGYLKRRGFGGEAVRVAVAAADAAASGSAEGSDGAPRGGSREDR